jgi:hypothetical protein
VCLHPDNKNGSYQCIRVVDLQTEIATLFEEREQMHKKQQREQMN